MAIKIHILFNLKNFVSVEISVNNNYNKKFKTKRFVCSIIINNQIN